MAEVVVFGVVAADVILRVQRIPAPGDHVNAEALGWRIGGSSANVACGLSMAGHHVRLVGPVGTDSMGDNLLAELEQYGVDTEYTFRADAASPRTLILLDDTGERTIMAVDSGAEPSSFLPTRGPDLRPVDCVYIEGYTRYPTHTATAAESALLVTSPPVPGATAWPATIVVGSETQYHDVTSAGTFGAVRSVSGERLEWVVVTRGREGADAYAASSEVHVDAVAADQIDATGAGDALTVGLLHGLLRGNDMVTALQVGATWGAATVAQLRSIPVPWEELAGPGDIRPLARMPPSVAPRQFPDLQATASRCEGLETHRASSRTRRQQPRNSLATSDQPPTTSRVVSPGQTVRVKSTGLPRRSW
jgi:sugar/nucleoside kinase (ribokinase family)